MNFINSFFFSHFLKGKLHASMRKAGMIKLIMPCMSTYVSDNPLLQRDSIGFIRLIAEDDCIKNNNNDNVFIF